MGRVVGTPAYLSPEVRAGEEPKPTADVWAVGMLLRDLAEDWVDQQKLGLAAAKLTRDERIFRKLLAKCLEKKPESRYQNAREIERDLELHRAAAGMSDSARLDSRLLYGGLVAGCAILLGLFILVRSGGEPPPLPPPNSAGSSSPNPAQIGAGSSQDGGSLVQETIAVPTADQPYELFIDGVDAGQVGQTPRAFSLTSGHHHFELRQNGQEVMPSTDYVVDLANPYINFNVPGAGQ